MNNSYKILLTLLVTFVGALTMTSPPPGAIGAYMDGVFPDSPPGKNSKWELVDPMPDITLPGPLKMIKLPNTDDHLVLIKGGIVYRINIENQEKSIALDISNQTFKLGDAGSLGIALHPKFGDPNHPEKQEVYIFYKSKPEPEEWSSLGYNRLSKFKWDDSIDAFDIDSEEILIQQFDRHEWHDGGGLFFDNDGYLLLSLGDEGADKYQVDSNQKINGGLFSGVLRLDVDNDPERSHPIRRQPIGYEDPPEGWWPTFTQGYSIPNINPWQDENGGILEEYIAIGARSPYSMHYDSENDEIWLADVGSDVREEINIVEDGDNLQWPYIEGTQESDVHAKPTELIGNEKSVYYEYDRTIGSCVIGGGIYRGTLFSELNGKYIFGDYSGHKLVALTRNGSNNAPEPEVLLNDLSGIPVGMMEKTRICGVHLAEDGNIYIMIFGADYAEESKILKLQSKNEVPDPPSKLSELGVFTDLQSLQVRNGIIPYTVNSPLWSDGAIKKRWMMVPNDGIFDSPSEQIKFDKEFNWTFPEGTVFIKHFELPLSNEEDAETARLETRFFVVGKDKRGYGLTYKWNDEGTEAFLLGGGETRNFDIFEEGEYAYTQTWEYPSRDQCLSCHNENAHYVLGVKTHQLNGNLEYIDMNQEMNQLDYMNSHKMFEEDLGFTGFMIKSYGIKDKNADLETRIASYLDANCSSCHQDGGIDDLNLDFRYTSAQNLKSFIDWPTASHASTSGRPIITKGEHENSEIWVRDASESSNQMPPLGRTFVDQLYADSLAKWIDNIDEEEVPVFKELTVYPNPTSDWIAIRIQENWEGPFTLDIQSISGHDIRRFQSDSHFEYVDLQNVPTGTYLLTVTAGEYRQTRKFVIR